MFITLAEVGLARQDYTLAIACSQASLNLGGDDFVTLLALKVAAYAHMGAGWSQIAAARGELAAASTGNGLAGNALSRVWGESGGSLTWPVAVLLEC